MKNQTIPNDSYVTIMGWMINELGLSGNLLICYAVIHGFSKDRESEYRGGRKYLAGVMGCSLQTVTTTLQKLEAMGLITRREEDISGVIFCRYKVNPEHIPTMRGVGKKLDYPSNEQGGVDKNLEGGIVKNFEGGVVKKFDPRNTILGNTNKGNIKPIGEKEKVATPKVFPLQKMKEMWLQHRPNYKRIWVESADMPALRQIGLILCGKEVSLVQDDVLTSNFQNFLFFLDKHNFYKDKPLKTIANNIQSILDLMTAEPPRPEHGSLKGADFFKEQEQHWQ